MERLGVDDTNVTIRLSRLEKLGAVHGDVVVPRAAVHAVRVVDDAWSEVHGLRAPGYALPGHALLGTWRHPGGKDFVDVHHGKPGLVVELAGAGFDRLVVSLGSAVEAQALAREIGAPTIS